MNLFRPQWCKPRLVLVALACAWALVGRVAQADEAVSTASPEVRVVNDESGSRIQVGGRDFMVLGMNWDYYPTGTNYSYDFWGQPDEFIRAALGREMPLMKAMGVNVIRQYVGIPPRWVKYIYETYGIWTVINHPLGRYGFSFDGVWTPVVDYSNPKQKAAIQADFLRTVDQFKGTPGMLMWLLGNENNYGLSWRSFEIEALPVGERNTARARHLYRFFGEVIDATHAHDATRPVAMANGDIQYLDLIAQECRNLDVFGTNVYRGISALDLFEKVKVKLGKPIVFTEFGSDAFNARDMREDGEMQARYLIGQWQEIYEQSAGKGRVGNCAGGMVFQWSDGWWKYKQETNLDVHDTNASWPNGGYDDYVKGNNNMNEEWWGICAKGVADGRGLYDLYPRAAYYALQKAWRLDPYAAGTDLATIRAHFASVDAASSEVSARGNHAALLASEGDRVRLTGVRMQLETISTGAVGTTTPASGASPALPQGLDHLQSFYVDMKASPAPNVTGTLSLNILGHVPENPIDDIFYEKRGKPVTITADGAPTDLQGIERLKVYGATVAWDEPLFRLDGFYRTGHYHWGYEGDFFDLYREANYGPNLDTYNADAPIGFEVAGKKMLTGLKMAFGPQLWWGANPTIMAKYQRQVGRFATTTMAQYDLARQTEIAGVSSGAFSVPQARKVSLHAASWVGPFQAEVGGLWAGQEKVGDTFYVLDRAPGRADVVRTDHVFRSDAFGARLRMTLERGRFRWYGQTARMGLVADGGSQQIMTYTGWALKDCGSGNQTNVISGFTYNMGDFQFGPNVLWQKPTVGPIPADVDHLTYPTVNPRNVSLNGDPFAVRANREMTGVEFVIGYDPTPATWLWAWDNDLREDARLAASLSLVHRHMPTTQDAASGLFFFGGALHQGVFPGAPSPHDLWDARLRLVSKLDPITRVVAVLYAGTSESNGSDDRVVKRMGVDARVSRGSIALAGAVRIDDYGPYDFHRDFNLTYPLQLMGDLSHTLGGARWLGLHQSSLGVRATYRTLDAYSPHYNDPTGLEGYEYEVRTYLRLAM